MLCKLSSQFFYIKGTIKAESDRKEPLPSAIQIITCGPIIKLKKHWSIPLLILNKKLHILAHMP